MVIEKEKPATGGTVGGLKGSSIAWNNRDSSEIKPRKQDEATKKWLLARARSAYSGADLVKRAVRTLGEDLAAGRIDNEQAAWDLNAIEETPLLYLSSLLTPACSEAA